jgi:hypothetical protein
MKVFIHVDADPDSDADSFFSSLRQRNPHSVQWKSLTSTISIFETYKEKMSDSGRDFKAVFFLRADEQIRALYGAFSSIFAKFHDDISKSFGLGWHPHLLRWFDEPKCWSQESKDNAWIQGMLTSCYDDLRTQGFNVKYTKMGWCFHSNRSMQTLSDLGIEADFSALPGARSPGRLIGYRSFQDHYDWHKTEPIPYHPNQQDYQSPGDLGILEIPQTMYQVRGVKEFLFTAKMGLPFYRKLDFSYIPSLRRSVPVFLLDLINMRDLESFCESLVQEDQKYVTLYLHPGDLSKSTAQIVFENFVQGLISAADRRSVVLSFTDAQELSGLCASL